MTQTRAETIPPPPAPSFYRLAIILGALAALGPLSIDMYLPSFPAIAADLQVDSSAVQMTVAVYFIGLALGQVIYGPLSDRFGRKLPLYGGLVIFILASFGCALAADIDALAGFRLIQALGGCAQMVVARAIVRDHFDERDSTRILSLLILVMGAAPILAPLVGGVLVEVFGWRSIFWVLGGCGVLSILAAHLFLPESLPAHARRSLNLLSILRIYGNLLRDRLFMAQTLTGGFTLGGMFAYITGSPFVFMDLFGLSPQYYGVAFGANAFGLIFAAQINGRLARHYDAHRVMRVTLPLSAGFGILLLAATLSGVGGFAGILVPLFFFIATLGFIGPLTTVLAMSTQGQNAGSASALLGMLQFLAGAGAGALVGLLHNGSALPMALVIAACAMAAAVTYWLGGQGDSEAQSV